jgi:hypothetical protein
VGYGRDTLEALDAATVSTRQNRVELSRADGAVVEWYENRATGLEQGFTVTRPPQGGTGPLRLVLRAEGDLRPELEQGGGSMAVEFVGAGGTATTRVGPPHPMHAVAHCRQVAIHADRNRC